jgi:hypothetical protein
MIPALPTAPVLLPGAVSALLLAAAALLATRLGLQAFDTV